MNDNLQNHSYSESISSFFASEPAEEKPLHSTREILDWIHERNSTLAVNIRQVSLEECSPWYYEEAEGCIRNTDGSFFRIFGLAQTQNGKTITEQPVIVQDEIGFLGIVATKINNTWHYLMQAKIEPGNVNVVQISPTLQATKSNFTCRHGGRKPAYLELFLDMDPGDIIVDQIQSEQSSRFLKKRNRNVILISHRILEEPDSHRWMTLKQLKELMHYDNLVNMDTRTVLSCIPYVLMRQDADVPFNNRPYFYRTAWTMNRRTIVELYHRINDYKMLSDVHTGLVPLSELKSWEMKDGTLSCKNGYPFRVIFCDINIEGREVTHWRQPLFAANGSSVFGLICCDIDGILKFLVKIRPEPGCFDMAEIGPTVQFEAGLSHTDDDDIEKLFFRKLEQNQDIVIDCILSEEGGRFYREQNRNVIMSVSRSEAEILPEGYVWSDYGTLNLLTQVNNCLNIQLRNLLSLLEV